jgi:hypothetical protein
MERMLWPAWPLAGIQFLTTSQGQRYQSIFCATPEKQVGVANDVDKLAMVRK